MVKRRSKAGRPSKPGPRTPKGRRSRAGKPKDSGNIEPNDRVILTRQTFAWFKGGAAAEAHDPIGRAWLVGLLDDQSVHATRLRDAARQYGEDYWSYYGKTGLAMADLEPEARGSGASRPRDDDFLPEDHQGQWLASIDALLMRAGRHIRDALHNVTVDQFFFPDDNPKWLERLITGRRIAERARLVKARRLTADEPPILGALPGKVDELKLTNLLRALIILSTGKIPAPETVVPATAPEEPEPPKPLPPIDPAFLNEAGRMLEGPDIADIIRERHAASQQGEAA